jgi:hypothetical protein
MLLWTKYCNMGYLYVFISVDETNYKALGQLCANGESNMKLLLGTCILYRLTVSTSILPSLIR